MFHEFLISFGVEYLSRYVFVNISAVYVTMVCAMKTEIAVGAFLRDLGSKINKQKPRTASRFWQILTHFHRVIFGMVMVSMM